jgi:predicted small metal-binding protein
MGADCDFVARGETEEELFAVAAAHGVEVHQVEEITPEMVQMARQVIREE